MNNVNFSHWFQKKLKERQGLGTLEIVVIIAVLLAVALLFREQIMEFASKLMEKAFDRSVLDNLG